MTPTATTADLMALPLQASADALSEALAVLVAGVFFTAIALIILYNRWNRPDLDPTHAAHLLSQLNGFGAGAGVILRSREELDDPEVMADIRRLFTEGTSEQQTTRGATREIIREVRDELADRSPKLPTLATGLLLESLLIAVFGAITVKSLDWWRDAATGGGNLLPSVGDATGYAVDAVTFALDAANWFPFIPETLSFLFAIAVSLGSALWTAWFIPAVITFAAGATHLALDKRVPDSADLHGPGAWLWIKRLTVMFAIAWTVGAALANGYSILFLPILAIAGVLAGVVHYADLYPEVRAQLRDVVLARDPRRVAIAAGAAALAMTATTFLPTSIADIIGYIAGCGIVAGLSGYWVKQAVERWMWVAEHRGRDATLLTLSWSFGMFAGLATLPLAVGYLAVSVGTGKALAVAATIADAPSATTIALAFAVLAVLAATIVFWFDLLRDIRSAIGRAFAIQSVRTALFVRGMPAVVVVITAATLLSFGGGVLLAAGAATAAGVVAVVIARLYNRVTYYRATREPRDRGANRVVVHGKTIDDADGEPVYVASVGGHRIAHRNLDPIVDQIYADARELFNTGTPESGSFARYYYREGVRRGVPDIHRVKSGLIGDIRTRLRENVRREANAADIRDILFSNYPDAAVKAVIRDMKRRNILTEREDTFHLRR